MLVVGPAIVFWLAMKVAANTQGSCNLTESVGAAGMIFLLPCVTASLVALVYHYRNPRSASPAALTSVALGAAAIYVSFFLVPTALCWP